MGTAADTAADTRTPPPSCPPTPPDGRLAGKIPLEAWDG